MISFDFFALCIDTNFIFFKGFSIFFYILIFFLSFDCTQTNNTTILLLIFLSFFILLSHFFYFFFYLSWFNIYNTSDYCCAYFPTHFILHFYIEWNRFLFFLNFAMLKWKMNVYKSENCFYIRFKRAFTNFVTVTVQFLDPPYIFFLIMCMLLLCLSRPLSLWTFFCDDYYVCVLCFILLLSGFSLFRNRYGICEWSRRNFVFNFVSFFCVVYISWIIFYHLRALGFCLF